MIVFPENNETNNRIALELVRRFLDSVDKDDLLENVEKYSKKCKKIFIDALKALKEYDEKESTIDYVPSI